MLRIKTIHHYHRPTTGKSAHCGLHIYDTATGAAQRETWDAITFTCRRRGGERQ